MPTGAENGSNEQEYRRLSAALAAEEERLAAIGNQLPIGVILVDRFRRIVRMNTRAMELCPLLGCGVVGDTLTAIARRAFADLLAARDPVIPAVLETAEPRHALQVQIRDLASGPDAGGWLLTVTDVTEQRQAQEKLARQERLAAVGQLAAGIAHDFNNYLTSVLGLAGLMRSASGIPADWVENLDVILRQGRRAAELVQRLLDFARCTPARLRRVDLVLLVRESMRLLRPAIPESVSVVAEIRAGEYCVDADPAQMQQVLANLVTNARDAMPGGGSLTIGLSALTAPAGATPLIPGMKAGRWVVLKVVDTGTGVAPEVAGRLFEPFVTTKEPGAGTGLGLAQVYGIVQQHRGFVDFDTEPGRGSRFFVYLPAAEGEPAAPAQSAAGAPKGRGETILLVEDEAHVRRTTRVLLEHLGYRVLDAGDGEAALRLLDEHGPEVDLLLTDLVMPRMGGEELCRRVAAMALKARVLVMSGYPLDTPSRGLLDRGAVATISKPLEMETLARTIRGLLDGSPR